MEEYGWPYLDKQSSNEIEKNILKEDENFVVFRKILDYDIIFGKFKKLDSAKSFKRKLLENGWNFNIQSRPTKYGKYIKKNDNRFSIVRDVEGVQKTFKSFHSLDDAIKYRDELISTNWGMPKEKILSNLGIFEFDVNMGKVGRRYCVFEWKKNKCIIHGVYRFRNDANKVKNMLKQNMGDSFYYEDEFHYKDTKFIHTVGDKFRISKFFNGGITHFGYYDSLDEAISIRDKLIKNDWDDSFLNLNRTYRDAKLINKNIHKTSRGFDVVKRVDGVLINFGSFGNLDDAISYRDELEENDWIIESNEDDFVEEKYDEFIYLKADSKYYLKNEIDGEMRIFGIFDNPLDAIAFRLDCIKTNWDFISISEDDYLENPSLKHYLDGDVELIEEINSGEYEDVPNDVLDFPVTVGKSFKNRGWAITRGYLEDLVPFSQYEKKCDVLINGNLVHGKINIHTRLFYFKNDELSNYLEKLYNIDPKTQTRINFVLDHGKYNILNNIGGNTLSFKTKFSKSFKSGLFAIPRSISKNIIPILPYESNCSFLVHDIPVQGKFNLEFRYKFSDKSIISFLESKIDDNSDMDILLIL